MEALIAILILLLIGAPIIGVVMLVVAFQRLGDLERRLHALERDLHDLQRDQLLGEPPAEPRKGAPRPSHTGRSEPIPPPPSKVVTPTSSQPAAPPPAREREEPAAARVARELTPPAKPEPTPEPERSREVTPIEQRLAGMATAANRKLRGIIQRGEEDEQAEQEQAPPTAEQRVTQVMLWLGAIALGLAGVFLVRYAAEHALMTPMRRLLLAGVAGVGLLGGGQLFGPQQRKVAAAMTAAGIVVCYAAVWAATNLYEMLSPTLGAILLAGITALAVLMSLRHGLIVAILGLVGGFLMPALTGMTSESALEFFGYMLVLQSGLAVVARYREWWPLLAMALLGSLGWTAAWLLLYANPEDWAVGVFILISAGTFVGLALEMDRRDEGEAEPATAESATFIAWAAALGWLVLGGLFVYVREDGAWEWVQMTVLAVGCVAVGRLREQRHAVVALLGLLVIAAKLWTWAAGVDQADASRFLWTLLGVGGAIGLSSYLAMWGSRGPRWWARAVVGLIAGGVSLAWWYVGAMREPLPWWLVSLIAAAVLGGMASHTSRHRNGDGAAEMTAAMGTFAIGASAMVAMGLYQLLAGEIANGRQWVAVAWAAQMVASIAIARRLQLRDLYVPAIALAVLVLVRLLLNPQVVTDYRIAPTPVLNWLLFAYGLAAACFAAGAQLTRRGRMRAFGRLLEFGAIVLITAGGWLIVRHAYHAPELDEGAVTLSEATWYVMLTGVLALALWEGGRLLRRPLVQWAGAVLTGVTGIAAVVWLSLIENPLWNRDARVGETLIWNALLWTYVAPAALAALAAWRLRFSRWFIADLARPTRLTLSGVALWMSFWWVTLSVRQGFHGSSLWLEHSTSSAEWYTYSAAWIGFAAMLLAIGIWRGGQTLRWASLVIMCIAVGKVFILDMAHLEDLWRVASFFGLGLSLLAVVWVYQRFVFSPLRRRREPEHADDEAGGAAESSSG